MTVFDDREDKFEKQFVHDQALKFKVEARRNKLLGLWAAELLGHQGAEAEEYAGTVVLADLEEPGDEDVFRKLRGDLDKAMKPVSDETIRDKMAELLTTGKQQVREGL